MGCEATNNASSIVVSHSCSLGAENYLGNNTARRLLREAADGLYRAGEPMIAAELKQRLNERAQEFAHYLLPAGKKAGNAWLVGSLAGDTGKSLSIRIAGSKVGVWSDFATGESGSNLLELYIQKRQVNCATAIKDCSEWLGVPVNSREHHHISERKEPRANAAKGTYPGEIYQPSEPERTRVMSMIGALRDDPELCQRLAKVRGWKPETIRSLALEGYLGWGEAKVCFIYDCGVKVRTWGSDERLFRWAFGKPWLWRGAYLNWAQEVYLCEGETDAIALIDAGLEEQNAKAVAIALPSASTFNPQWAQLFEGKNVALVLDADAAGRAATERITRLLAPLVASLKHYAWEARDVA